MKHNKVFKPFKILLSLLILTSMFSCERDDICASATPTTPHLIVSFYNINDRTELKTVRRMRVKEANNPKLIIDDSTKNSITLPLRIEVLDNLNTTRFELTRDVDFISDEDTTTEANTDILEVTYTPELIYVSRACGYKSIFNGVIAGRESDPNNWIIDVEVINTTINNENAAHINIYH